MTNSWVPSGVARIIRQNRIGGAGFLATRTGLVVTCEHVVRKLDAQVGDSLLVDFREGSQPSTAEVILCDQSEDVAILRLEESELVNVTPMLLGSSAGAVGRTFSTFGFPVASPTSGLAGECRVVGLGMPNGKHRLQVRSNEVTTGFSGAPVWDQQLRAVIGMVSSIIAEDAFGKQRLTAFVIPAESFDQIHPELRRPIGDPYRSLDHFKEQDTEIYFGREKDSAELLELISQKDAVLFVGVSGSGKSSLVRAGIAKGLAASPPPALARRERCLVLPSSSPLTSLLVALEGLPGRSFEEIGQELGIADLNLQGQIYSAVALQLMQQGPEAIARGIRACAGDHGLLIIVDQLESCCSEQEISDEGSCLVDSLLSAVGQAVKVLFVLRSDFYTIALKHRGLVDLVRNNCQITPSIMQESELLAAIEEPARLLGRGLEPGLSARIVSDLGDALGNLPLLEFALTELWNADNEKGVLTAESYKKLGLRSSNGWIPGVRGAIARRAEEVWNNANDEERVAIRRIFLRLVVSRYSDMSNPQTKNIGQPVHHSDWDPTTQSVVAQLIDARLLASGQDSITHRPVVAVAHVALIQAWPRLHNWVDESSAYLIWYNAELLPFLGAWQDSGCAPEYLLPEPALPLAREWSSRYAAELEGAPLEYICLSIEKAERVELDRHRKQRRIAVVTTALSVVFLALAAISRVFWRRAEEQQLISLSRQLAAQSNEFLDTQYDLSLLLSLQARNFADIRDSRQAISEALEGRPELTRYLSYAYDHNKQVAMDPGGSFLVTTICTEPNAASGTGCPATKLSLWDASTGDVTAMLTQTGSLGPIALSPDGRTLAVSQSPLDAETQILMMSREGFDELYAPIQETALVLTFSPDGQLLATGDFSGEVLLWDARNGELVGRLIVHEGPVTGLSFRSDGQVLASADYNGLIVLSDVKSGNLVSTVAATGSGSGEHRVAFGMDSEMLIACQSRTASAETGRDDWLALWDTHKDSLVHIESVTAGGSCPVQIAAGGTVIVGELDIALRDLTTLQPIHEGLGYHNINAMVMSADREGDLIVSAGLEEVLLWDLNRESRISTRLQNHSGRVTDVAFHPSGRELASTGFDGAVVIRNLTSGTIPHILRGSWGQMRGVAYSPDGMLLAACGDDSKIRIWDTEDYGLRRTLAASRDGCYSVAFDPHSRILASSGPDRMIRLWHTDTWSMLRSPVHVGDEPFADLLFDYDWTAANSLLGLSFSSDGRALAIGGATKCPLIMNLQDYTLSCLDDPQDMLTSLIAFGGESDMIVSANAFKGGVSIWDPQTKQLVQRVRQQDDIVTGLALSPDGRMFALATLQSASVFESSAAIELWSLETGKLSTTLQDAEHGVIQSLVFGPDGRTLASTSLSGSVRLWDIDAASWQHRACAIVGRNFTMEEWSHYIGSDAAYERTCPMFGPGVGAPEDAPSARGFPSDPQGLNLAGNPEFAARVSMLDKPGESVRTVDGTEEPQANRDWRTETSELPDGVDSVFPAFIRCREDSASDHFKNEYFGLWAVSLGSRQRHLDSADAAVRVETGDGEEIMAYDALISPGGPSVGWIMAKDNLDGYVLQGSESVATVLKLTVQNATWVEEPLVASAEYEIELRDHFTYGDVDYPQHSVALMIHNAGQKWLAADRVIGVVTNRLGEAVDIIYAEPKKMLDPSDTMSLLITSKSRTGRCVGPADPNGYVIHFWVEFRSRRSGSWTEYGSVLIDGDGSVISPGSH